MPFEAPAFNSVFSTPNFPRFGHSFWLGILSLVLLLMTGCGRKSEPPGQNPASETQNGTVTIAGPPPFSTKEPERYQAHRSIYGYVRFRDANGASQIQTFDREVLVTKDGLKRRIDFQAPSGERVYYLEIAEGNFLVSDSRHLSARVDPEKSGGKTVAEQLTEAGVSSNRFLTPNVGGSDFEELGREDLKGRPSMKYRAKFRQTGEANQAQETVWVDEGLGIPIRTEISSGNGDAVYVIEMSDITTDIPPAILNPPRGYQEVASHAVLYP